MSQDNKSGTGTLNRPGSTDEFGISETIETTFIGIGEIVDDRSEIARELRTPASARPKRVKLHQNGPRNPWEIDIDVYLNSVGPAPGYQANFEVETCLPLEPNGNDPNPRVQFCNEGRAAGFKINFRLYDNTNNGGPSGYRFPLAAEDGVWSQLGTDCPTEPAYDVFEEDSLDVKDKGLTLVASNPNSDPAQGLFQYRLNVSLDGNPPYVALDPGGNNLNGGGGRDQD